MKSFIANLKLAHKFLLISLIAAAMISVTLALTVSKNVADLRFARSELLGVKPADDTLKLIQLTQQHRGQSAMFLGGNESLAGPRQSKQAEVERALAKAQASAATLGDQKLVALVGSIATEWQSLAAGVGNKSLAGPQSLARHTALIAEQLSMLEDIANVSGIVLHPEASLYFLQNGVLTHLPRLTEALGQLRARGALLLAKGEATPEDKTRLAALVSQARTNYRDANKALELSIQSDPAIRVAIAAPLAAAQAAVEQGLTLVDEKIVRTDKLSFSSAEYFSVTTRIIDVQFALVDTAFTALGTQLHQTVEAARLELITLLVGAAVLSALTLWIMWTIARTTTASVGAALQLAESVAAGDLSSKTPAAGRDEIGQLLRALGTMNDSLGHVVSGVRQNAEGVATASAQIAQGNQDLSQRTEEQAAALEETAASMEQLSSTVKQNADNAKQANQLALGASTVAIKGGNVVGRAVDTMKGINDSSKKIADIIGVIDGIAFQTNILALNAAVEAARAGEQGRGFAVVAAEVRSLAGRSADAAKEIKGLITASVERVEQGTALVDQAGATMTEIVASIKRVTDIMGEISAASSEQSASVAQIGEAVSQMDQATQQNAALVEESAAAAESLRDQAQQLVQAVAVFKLDDAGQTYTPASMRPIATSNPNAAPAERRGPNRAKNVARPAFGAKGRPDAPTLTTEATSRRSGTDDEWTSF